MKLNTEHNAFFTYIAKYLGVALIAGSVVHIGTLQNGVTRYVVLIAIGLILTILGNLKEAKEHGQKINLNYFLIITGLSFATGFLSGGIQHYLDNPSYAGVLLGIGVVITYITFFLKDKFKLKKKNIAVVVLLAVVFILFSHFVMDNTLLGENHHGNESSQH
jgi:predicted PurR-regulated permease PerM